MKWIGVGAVILCVGVSLTFGNGGIGGGQDDVILDPKGGSLVGKGGVPLTFGELIVTSRVEKKKTTARGKKGMSRADVGVLPYIIKNSRRTDYYKLEFVFDRSRKPYAKLERNSSGVIVAYVGLDEQRARPIRTYCDPHKPATCKGHGMPWAFHGEVESCVLWYLDDSSGEPVETSVDCDGEITLTPATGP